MTLNAHRRRDRKRCIRTRVWLNDVEVTNRCFYADGRRGVVRLYKLNERGQKYLEPIIDAPHWAVPRRVAMEELRGRVRWGRKVAA
jgi:hypothetical protein